MKLHCSSTEMQSVALSCNANVVLNIHARQINIILHLNINLVSTYSVVVQHTTKRYLFTNLDIKVYLLVSIELKKPKPVPNALPLVVVSFSSRALFFPYFPRNCNSARDFSAACMGRRINRLDDGRGLRLKD